MAKSGPFSNPFFYGKPVPVERHIDRYLELRTLFSRLRNGECTAIVGEPRIGKTSLLRYVAEPGVYTEWLGEAARSMIPVEVDFYEGWLSPERTPKDFWKQILETVVSTPDCDVESQVALVGENEYGSATLTNLFRSLGRNGWRVVLFIDEFDALLTHPNFSTAEFLGGLRSMATRTDGLQVITASIMSVSEMNRRATGSNPLGSPFFNQFTEVNLRPFSLKAVGELIDLALRDSGIHFGRTDRNFIVRLSGRHPYRVQAAGACLFEAIMDRLGNEERYEMATILFYERTAAHFDALWRLYLDDPARTAMLLLSLVELGGAVQGRRFSFGEIERSEKFAPELRRLAKMGLVEKASDDSQWDREHLLFWQDGHWRVTAGGFTLWLADVVIGGTRDIPDFEQWLHDQERIGLLLTRKQWRMLRELLSKIPKSVLTGVAGLAKQFVHEWFDATK